MTASWNPRDFDRYRLGNARQRAAWLALRSVGGRLQEFDPVLAGTIPLDADIEGSDVDLICCAEDLAPFEGRAAQFDDERGFSSWRGEVAGEPTCIVRFERGGFPIELFAQAVPCDRQAAVRHLRTEHALLERHGEPLRALVRRLKRSGLSTEQAFCRALALEGDPYVVLLELPELTELVDCPDG